MLPERIRVDSFLLADAAKAFDGKLYIHGGGWNFLNIFDPTVARPITVAGRVIVPWEDTREEIRVDLSLEYIKAGELVERAPIARIVMQPQIRLDQPMALETATPFVFDIPGIVFFHPGEYAFVLSEAGQELARTRLQVNLMSGDS